MPEEPQVETEAEVKTFDENYVKELRSEAKTYRLNLRETEKSVEALKDELKSFKDADKTEVEKLTERAAMAERALADKDREIAEAQTRSKVVSEATRMGFANPGVAYQLVDLASIDEDPKTIKKALESLIKSEPYLVKSQPPSPGTGGQPIAGKPSPDQMLLRMMKK